MKFCPEKCSFLQPTEEGQNRMAMKNGSRPAHMCVLFGKVLKHEIYHPQIVRCDECIEADDFYTESSTISEDAWNQWKNRS